MTSRTVAVVVTRFEAGAGVVALRGALGLDPAAFRPTIVTGRGERLLGVAREAGIEVVVEPALVSPVSPADDVRALHRLTRLFARRRFDVVHTHSAKAGALGRLAAHRTGVPRIVHTFHGLPYHEFESAARRGLYAGIERRLGRCTDVALCVGTAVSVEVVRRGLVAPERVRTIGVPVAQDAPVKTPAARSRARAALGLTGPGPVVGAVGRLAYQKHPEAFVRALAALRHRPGLTGVWLGGGELAGEVSRLAERDGAPVLFPGERADVPDLLPAFDVFALPSRYEGLPVAVVEAMVCGIPVVATAVNAVPDVVVPGRTGLLVPPQRPDALARAVAHLLDHPREAARMVAEARARIDDRFTAKTLSEDLSAAYTPESP
ncbi:MULTISPECIES: glycosyltransferase family 4 protein [Streptomyces]|uniref:Glycosyltransferase family 1 protein n=2 Tax=Streptomyces TaxID=1883 RepID=A0A2U9PAM6_STRAS|nr:glycosyltransferase family 4 protein [Streptomyces actuosus]AWT46612.1 glycosyltransferase family 1 protein [Streptomyces actuosus]MBM4823329.1 glycosyltransferase family 4 protein [Streptomyces actuosus]